MKKVKQIEFEPSGLEFPNLALSKKHIPKWYIESKKFVGDKPKFFPEKTIGIKECVPFLEAFITGYIIELPADLLVEIIDDELKFTWNADYGLRLVEIRDAKFVGNMPVANEFYPISAAWSTQIAIKVPSGYSMLLTHPLNRVDLPFFTLSGVVDSFAMNRGNIPFFLKKGFLGLIPAGTPIAQIIPFKIENWKSKLKPGLMNEAEINTKKSAHTLYGWYKKNVWKKKYYE